MEKNHHVYWESFPVRFIQLFWKESPVSGLCNQYVVHHKKVLLASWYGYEILFILCLESKESEEITVSPLVLSLSVML